MYCNIILNPRPKQPDPVNFAKLNFRKPAYSIQPGDRIQLGDRVFGTTGLPIGFYSVEAIAHHIDGRMSIMVSYRGVLHRVELHRSILLMVEQ